MIFYDDNVAPIEIKKSSNPTKTMAENFSVLKKTPFKTAPGGIICLCSDYSPMDENNWYIPASVI